MDKLISGEKIENKIYQIRGRRVMLDEDLALLYSVETKYLTRQVRRNLERFPEDFMFRLTKQEFLRCQNVTSRYGGRRYLPYDYIPRPGLEMVNVRSPPTGVRRIPGRQAVQLWSWSMTFLIR